MYGEGQQRIQVASTVMATAGGFSSVRNRLMRGGVWVFAGRCGGIAGQFALNLLLTRLLAIHDFGTYVFLTSIVVPASMVAMLGFNRLAIKWIAEGLHDVQRQRVGAVLRFLAAGSLSSIIAISVLAGVVLHMTLPWIDPGLDAWWVAPLLAAWIALLASHQLLAEMLRGFHELRFASLVMGQSGGPILNGLLVLILATTAAISAVNLTSALIATVAAFGLLLPLLISWLILTAKSHGCFQGSDASQADHDAVHHGLDLRTVVRSCGMLVIGQVLLFAVSQGDVWISAWTLESADVAVLGAARRLVLVAAVPSFLVNMTVVSCIPDLHAQGRLAELQKILRSSAGIAMLLSMAAFVPLLVMPGYCLRVLFTPQYESGAVIVVILAISNCVYTWSGSSLLVLQLTGRERCAALIQLLAAGILFLAGPMIAQIYGLTALACVSATAMAIVCIGTWLAVRWTVGIWTHPHLSFRSVSSLARYWS